MHLASSKSRLTDDEIIRENTAIIYTIFLMFSYEKNFYGFPWQHFRFYA